MEQSGKRDVRLRPNRGERKIWKDEEGLVNQFVWDLLGLTCTGGHWEIRALGGSALL